jgi:hypothetical protein
MMKPELTDELDKLASQLDTIEPQGNMPTETWYRIAVGNLTQLSKQAEALARSVALRGISESIITRKTAAELLDVHPHTISRWVAAHEAEVTPVPDQGYRPDSSL